VEGGELRVFVHEFRQAPTGAIGWTGRDRIVSLSLPGLRPTSDGPSPGDDPAARVQHIQWGAAVLEEASHTYVYGAEDLEGGAKRAYVARFPRGAATGGWRFWDGGGWVADPAAAAPLGGGAGGDPVASTPGTVARLGAGYVLLSIADFGTTVDARTSCAPTGPWSPARRLYRIPELPSPTGAGDIAFLARGYPAGDGLLVAYSLSTDDLGEQMRRASYYRPRYIRVR
jgi:hypothetical protein